ncbi:MAG: SGNH/GDSL hydrolase family protein [Acidimicrobiales bacterium]
MLPTPSGRVRGSLAIALLCIVCAALAACGSSSANPNSATSSSTTRTTTNQVQYYVSLGDSYAAGYQPSGTHSGRTDTNGFAYQIPALAAAKGYDFKLVNFGCGGATTTSILSSVGCPPSLLGPGATPYPTVTQAAAAEAFVRAHRGDVGLITVSISGNDVTPCASEPQPIECVVDAVKTINKNVSTLLTGLRSAAGPSVPIVGTTYPDVILGLYVSKVPSSRSLALLSVTAFKEVINPALKKQYASVGGTFVDVTAATGAYGSMKTLTDLPPYGTIPLPVAKVCELTFFCQYHDIHPRTAGYTIIAKLVVGTLPDRSTP